MKTGSQIEKINQFSITSFFWRLLDSVRQLGLPAGRLGLQAQACPAMHAGAAEHWLPAQLDPLRLLSPSLPQAFNLLGNAGIGTADTANISSTPQPTVPANAGTDAELAAGQQVPQAQEQPLAAGSR